METIRKMVLIIAIAVIGQQAEAQRMVYHRHHHTAGSHVKKHHPVKVVHRHHRSRMVVIRPRKTVVINALPAGHLKIVHRSSPYFFHQGFYYQQVAGAYHIIPAPIGMRIRVLPDRHQKIVFNSRPYFYAQGTWYVQAGEEYEVVTPEKGMIVSDLPDELSEELSENETGYVACADQLYQKKVQDGQTVYEMVGTLEE